LTRSNETREATKALKLQLISTIQSVRMEGICDLMHSKMEKKVIILKR